MAEFRDAFWEHICELAGLWRLLFVVTVALLVFLVPAAVFVTPGSASYYVMMFSAFLGFSLAVATGYVIRKCE